MGTTKGILSNAKYKMKLQKPKGTPPRGGGYVLLKSTKITIGCIARKVTQFMESLFKNSLHYSMEGLNGLVERAPRLLLRVPVVWVWGLVFAGLVAWAGGLAGVGKGWRPPIFGGGRVG